MPAKTKASITRDIAAWTASLSYADIPTRVSALAKSQAASVFASAHAGKDTVESQRILEATRRFSPPGKSPVIATGELTHLDAALAANAALGMAQDYDDYLFMGHTGHSAVWTAFLVGLETGASAEEVLTALVAANEVAGRLGAACILGPQNGQLWTHIHLAGTVIAAGKLYGLTADQFANALGIAYAQPVYGLFPGFMGPGSKLLSASTPMQVGLQAVRYARAGLTGSQTILEDEQGFLRHFSYRPIETMLTGWGTSWVTDTLAIKPYPGCAYIDTTIDAILELREKLAAAGTPLDASRIKSVAVEASLLTVEMDRLSSRHFDDQQLTPININFNIPINAAIALLHGDLTSRHLTEPFLDANREQILAVASKVKLTHDWSATLDLLSDLNHSVGVRRFFAGFGLNDVSYIRTRLKRDGHARLEFGIGDLGQIVRAVSGGRGSAEGAKSGSLAGVDFGAVKLPFRSKVTITLDDGSAHTAVCRLPRGCAAKGDLHDVARAKLIKELSASCSAEQATLAWEAIVNLESTGIAKALAAVTIASVPS